MKKTMFVVLLVVNLALAACAQAPAAPAVPAATEAPAATALPVATEAPAATAVPAATEKVEVIWYVRSNAIEQAWENGVIPPFEAAHPNIKINLVVVPWADFDTKMQTMIAAGTPPDVWSHWGPSGYGDYVRRGLVANLTPLVERDKYDLSDFFPSVLNVFKVEDKVMGLPILITGSYIFYNKDLLDAAGVEYPPINWDDTSWTWDAFVEKCKALTKDTDDPAKVIFGCGMDAISYQYPWLWGQPMYPDEASTTGFAEEAYMDTPGSIAGFQARQDLVWKLHYMPDPAQTDAMGGSEIFQTGKVAMLLTGGFSWWAYNGMDLHEKFKWGVAALPYADPGRKDVTFADPWMMSSKTAHPDEAWEFMKYLASAEVQENWMTTTGCSPVRKSLEERWYGLFPSMTPEEVKEVYQGSLKYGVESYDNLMMRADRIAQVISSGLDPVYNNDATAADALPDLDKQLEQTLKEIKAEYAK